MIRIGRVNSKRQNAIDHIRTEIAQEGQVTARATRLYVENRISYAVFQKTIREGMAWRAKQAAKPEADRGPV